MFRKIKEKSNRLLKTEEYFPSNVTNMTPSIFKMEYIRKFSYDVFSQFTNNFETAFSLKNIEKQTIFKVES